MTIVERMLVRDYPGHEIELVGRHVIVAVGGRRIGRVPILAQWKEDGWVRVRVEVPDLVEVAASVAEVKIWLALDD